MASRIAGGFTQAKGFIFASPDDKSSKSSTLELLTECHSRYGDYLAVESDSEEPLYLLAHPSAVEHVLSNFQDKYVKPDGFVSKITSLIGAGLLTSDGDEWLKQRRLIQPAFDAAELERMAQIIASCVGHLMAGWDKLLPGHEIDLFRELVLLTETIAVELMFGSDQDNESNELKASLIETLYLLRHFQHEYRMTIVEGDLTERRLQAADRKFNKLVLELVDRRKESPTADRRDFLSFILGGNCGPIPEEKYILDQARTLLIVGHSNVASAVAWSLYTLSRHQTARERVLAELSALSGGSIGFSTLNSIPYTMLAVDEVLRLYPPTFAVVRQLKEDDVIEERTLPAGSLVMLSQWITHRHPEFWTDPETFDPERFTPERSAGRHKYAYFPFGAGGRRCVARNLALVEVLLTLSAIMSEYEILFLSEQPAKPFPSVVLIPESGFPAIVKRRA